MGGPEANMSQAITTASDHGIAHQGALNGQWHHGLCACCDPGCMHCCINYYCCGPCNFGTAMHKLTGANCFLHCCCISCCHACDRCAVVEKQGIKNEGGCMSFLMCLCCPFCSMAQIIGEVEYAVHAKAGCCGKWEESTAQVPQA